MSICNDKEYTLTLLLGCIDALSKELGLRSDTDPKYLVSEALLKQSLFIQYQGLAKAYSHLEGDYGFLLDSLENLIY